MTIEGAWMDRMQGLLNEVLEEPGFQDMKELPISLKISWTMKRSLATFNKGTRVIKIATKSLDATDEALKYLLRHELCHEDAGDHAQAFESAVRKRCGHSNKVLEEALEETRTAVRSYAVAGVRCSSHGLVTYVYSLNSKFSNEGYKRFVCKKCRGKLTYEVF